MPAAGFVTVAAVVLAVLVIAVYLIAVAYNLRAVSSNLDDVIAVVAQIPERTEPIAPVLGRINDELATARETLEQSRLGRLSSRTTRLRGLPS
jgi:uncharacterized protein YoxC